MMLNVCVKREEVIATIAEEPKKIVLVSILNAIMLAIEVILIQVVGSGYKYAINELKGSSCILVGMVWCDNLAKR